ncbi:hypothetical protein L0B53_14045 [Vibrio sp. SS-MA-C1-2]|uniref:carbohydrate-binding protein n=1 Tax=Vibrio sp. SS-MA-C1-2 TaxID=2908646 RepID=UPI001F27A089|nr:carbohydrate-binding protein [Vibrio sp. SS-MA-C1-2]UJF18133.1 hypothetical protein L0B53_14045 [Vibrio sp. SS-MA-C1-2]
MSLTLDLIPENEYRVATILLNNIEQPIVNPFIVENITNNFSLKISFEQGGQCPALWVFGTIYQGGDRVTYEGFIYEAKWYSDKEQPGSGDPWREVGECL